MDYKTNNLTELLSCEEVLLDEFPKLLFGRISNDIVVFDSTAFCQLHKINEEKLSYKVFQRTNKRYIEGLIGDNTDVKANLFYINKDGHILINSCLTFLYLMFITPNVIPYFNALIGEVMSGGVAYSDSFAAAIATDRLSNAQLKQIIEERESNEKEE